MRKSFKKGKDFLNKISTGIGDTDGVGSSAGGVGSISGRAPSWSNCPRLPQPPRDHPQ